MSHTALAVIFAAGRGTRLQPLTDTLAKPMVDDGGGMPIIGRIIQNLPAEISDVIVVVGYLKEQIIGFLGNEYSGRKISYAVQQSMGGTADALLTARPLIGNRSFLILNGDDLLPRVDLAEMLIHTRAVLAYRHPNPERFGVIEEDPKRFTLRRIVEKPKTPPSNLVSTRVFMMTPDIFRFGATGRDGELFLPSMVNAMVEDGQRVDVLEASGWVPIGTHEELAAARALLAANPSWGS